MTMTKAQVAQGRQKMASLSVKIEMRKKALQVRCPNLFQKSEVK